MTELLNVPMEDKEKKTAQSTGKDKSDFLNL